MCCCSTFSAVGPVNERRLTRQHLVQHACEAVDIASGVQLMATGRLLRTHVGRRPDSDVRLRDVLSPRRRPHPGDSEVHHLRVARGKQDVVRLDIAVHHALLIRVTQRLRHLLRDSQGVWDGKLLFSVETVAQRIAFHVGHDVIEQTVNVPRIVQRQDVRVSQASRDLNLAEKAARPQVVRQLRAEDLHGDLAVVFQVFRQVDGRHPTTPDLPLEGVSVRQCLR